jgi:thioesterase domain-containing protein
MTQIDDKVPVLPRYEFQDHRVNTIQISQPAEIADIFAKSNLTRLQVLYWISQKLRSTAPFLNTILAFTIYGTVEVGRFQKAFQAVIDHSDALRTVITEIDGAPQRRVSPDFPYDLEFVDLSNEPDPSTALETWMTGRISLPLSLDVCLFDSALIKIANEQFVWYLNQHHVNADVSSFFLTYERLAELYEQDWQGKSINVQAFPAFEMYVDYERKHRQSPQSEKALAYWKRKLVPGPELLRFFGKPVQKRSTRVERVTYELSRDHSQKLRGIANQEGIYAVSKEYSLYNVFAALFSICLHNLSGNQRLGFVTPIHNRFTHSFRNTVGLLMELCPLQIKIGMGDNFLSVIEKVKRETRETMRFYQVGSSLSLENNGFDVMFNLHPVPVLSFNGCRVEAKRIHPGHGSECLVLHIYDYAETGNLVLHFDFHTDVFSKEERGRTVELFTKTLDTFLMNQSSPIDDLYLNTVGLRGKYGHEPLNYFKYDPINQREIISPRDPVEYQLLQIWEELLGTYPISVKDNFFELGGTSWLAARLFLRINESMAKNLPLSTLLQATTVEQMANLIRTGTETELWSSAVNLQSEGQPPPFFFVPGAGGNLLRLADLARHVGPVQPFYAFQVPGFDGKQQPCTTIEQAASYFVDVMRSIQPSGPYFLGGYSWGGMVALEMAQQLQTKGQEIAMLAIVDSAAQSPRFIHIRHVTQNLMRLFRLDPEREEELFLILHDLFFELNYFVRKGAIEKAKHLVHRMRGFAKQTLMDVEKSSPFGSKRRRTDYWERFNLDPLRLALVRINARSYKIYVPQRYDGQVYVFKSLSGDQNPTSRSTDPQMGWEQIAAKGVEMHLIPGDHLSMMNEPNVITLATQLRKCIVETRANVASL